MSQPGILGVDEESLVLNNLPIQLKNKFNHKYLYKLAKSADEALEILEKLKKNNTPPSVLAKL